MASDLHARLIVEIEAHSEQLKRWLIADREHLAIALADKESFTVTVRPVPEVKDGR